MRPCVGLMKPSSALSIVLLPAPFGPSRPTRPRVEPGGDLLQCAVRAEDDRDGVQVHDRLVRSCVRGSRVVMTLLVSKS